MEIVGINLADVLRACNGDLTHKGLRAVGVGSVRVRRVVDALDKLGLTRRIGPRAQRVLALPLDEALQRVAGIVIPAPPQAPPRRRALPYLDMMRLCHDPGELFAPGATFPADQVLPRKWRKDDPDQWYIGTRFVRVRPGHPREYYEYDGEQVVKIVDSRP